MQTLHQMRLCANARYYEAVLAYAQACETQLRPNEILDVSERARAVLLSSDVCPQVYHAALEPLVTHNDAASARIALALYDRLRVRCA
jgi:hypothetical protein